MAVRTTRFRIDNDFNVDDLNRFFDRIAQTGGVITNQFQVQLRPGAVDYYVVFEDAVPPRVIRTAPFDGQAFVPALSDIVIIFSEDVVLGTTPFEIFKDGTPVVGFTFVEANGRVDISDAIDAIDGNYTVRVLRDEVADTSGNTMLLDFTFAFSSTGGVFAQVAGQIGGTSASPDIRGMRESGSTLLTYGAVADGQLLQRVGGTIVGVAAAAGGAGWKVLATKTAANDASIGFDALIDSTFGTYVVLCENVVPQTDALAFRMQFLAASVDKGTVALTGTGSFGVGNDVGEGFNADVHVFSTQDAALTATVDPRGVYIRETGATQSIALVGAASDQSVIDEFVFSFESGNIVSGKFTLIGISNTV